MVKYYIKNNVLKPADLIVVNKDGFNIINPSEEDILADGWVEYKEPEYKEPTAEELAEQEKEYWLHADYDYEVNRLIKERYSDSQEFALLRQKDIKPDEFKVYNDFCEECKAKVKLKMNI